MEHRDRLARFGFDLLKRLWPFRGDTLWS